MTSDLPDPLLAVLIVSLFVVSAAVLAVLRWDLRRLPRLQAGRRVIAAAEQALVDHDFRTITEPLEHP